MSPKNGEKNQRGRRIMGKRDAGTKALELAFSAVERVKGPSNPSIAGWGMTIDPAPYQSHSVSFSTD